MGGGYCSPSKYLPQTQDLRTSLVTSPSLRYAQLCSGSSVDFLVITYNTDVNKYIKYILK